MLSRLIFTLVLALGMPLFAHNISINIDDSPNSIHFIVPSSWSTLPDEDFEECDIQLVDEKGEKICWIFTTVLEEPSADEAQEVYKSMADELFEIVYPKSSQNILKLSFVPQNNLFYSLGKAISPVGEEQSIVTVIGQMEEYFFGFILQANGTDQELAEIATSILQQFSIVQN